MTDVKSEREELICPQCGVVGEHKMDCTDPSRYEGVVVTETLTDEERSDLEETGEGEKALRLLDAHAADRAALVAQLEAANAQADLFAERARNLETQWRGAEAQITRLTRELDEARGKTTETPARNSYGVGATVAEILRPTPVATIHRAIGVGEDVPPECDNCEAVIDGHLAATSDVCRDCWNRAHAAESEVTRLTAEIAALKKELVETTDDALKQRVEYWRESSQSAESRLAAANALLRRIKHEGVTPELRKRLVEYCGIDDAHLAAQPATAPAGIEDPSIK